MRTNVRVLASVSAFAVVTAVVYWFVSYEWTGTVLLAFLSLMPATVAVWLLRRGPVEGRQALADRPDARPEEAAGELVGSFTLASAWPLVLAIGAVVFGAGLIYGVILVPLGAVIIALALVGWIRQSRP